jgi:hypothetical protein
VKLRLAAFATKDSVSQSIGVSVYFKNPLIDLGRASSFRDSEKEIHIVSDKVGLLGVVSFGREPRKAAEASRSLDRITMAGVI